MVESEWQDILKRLQELWPRWQVTAEQLLTFKRRLLPYKHRDVLEAIRAHFEEDGGLRPKLKAIKARLEMCSAPIVPETETDARAAYAETLRRQWLEKRPEVRDWTIEQILTLADRLYQIRAQLRYGYVPRYFSWKHMAWVGPLGRDVEPKRPVPAVGWNNEQFVVDRAAKPLPAEAKEALKKLQNGDWLPRSEAGPASDTAGGEIAHQNGSDAVLQVASLDEPDEIPF